VHDLNKVGEQLIQQLSSTKYTTLAASKCSRSPNTLDRFPLNKRLRHQFGEHPEEVPGSCVESETRYTPNEIQMAQFEVTSYILAEDPQNKSLYTCHLNIPIDLTADMDMTSTFYSYLVARGYTARLSLRFVLQSLGGRLLR
jgi:hypothetical protein